MLLWIASIVIFAPGVRSEYGLDLIARCEVANTDCCACVSTPGCSWIFTDVKGRFKPSIPRCAPTSVQGPRKQKKSPDRFWRKHWFPKRFLKPIDPAKKWFISPQRIMMRQNVGMRQEPEFEVLSQTNVISFRVVDGSFNGGVNWTVVPTEVGGCKTFSAVWEDEYKWIKRGKYLKYNKYLNVECATDKPNQTQRFKMIVDTPACAHKAKAIEVVFDKKISKTKLKVMVHVKCECPCYSKPARKAYRPNIYSTGVKSNGIELFMKKRRHFCKDKCTFPAYKEVSECRNDMCTYKPYDAACSGHGKCLCGECLCDEGHTGTFCECDNSVCPLFEGDICGGPSRGVCDCGKCRCKGLRGGVACEVNQAWPIDDCVEHEHDIEKCSGQGLCIANHCECHAMFSGRFCQSVNQCPLYRHCARCFATAQGKTGGKPFDGNDVFSNGDPLCKRCGHDPTTRYTVATPVVHVAPGHDHSCLYMDETGCTYTFTYIQASHIYGHEMTIYVNTTVACDSPDTKPVFLLHDISDLIV